MQYFLLLLTSIASVVFAAPLSTGHNTPTVKQLYQFPNATFVENLAQTRKGDLLMTTFSLGRVYTINPNDAVPSPRIVAELPGVDTVTGIAEVAQDIFAVTAGRINSARNGFIIGSAAIFTIDIHRGLSKAVVRRVASIASAQLLNGMTALPSQQSTVLSADSYTGTIYRIDTRSGKVDKAITDPMFTPSPDPNVPPFGVNGIRISGDQLYFTNTGRGIFGKVRITQSGQRAGQIQTIATYTGPKAPDRGYDDFEVDAEGNAFVCLQTDSILRISPNGQQVLVAGGPGNTTFSGPTSIIRDRKSRKLFVSTAGETDNLMGQVVEISGIGATPDNNSRNVD